MINLQKYLIVGDVHWSVYSSIVRKRGLKYSVRLEKLIDSLNWVEDFAINNSCDGIIFLGDFCDRPDLNCEEITALQEVRWSKLPHTFLVGNHESNVLNLEFSSTKVFESINANVVSSPLTEEISQKINFNYIPYITTNKKLNLLDYIKDPTKKNVVFAHQEIAGVQYGKFISQSGFSLDDIENNCAIFIDGHLHNEAIYKNAIIVGNLTGQNLNEDAITHDHLVYMLTIDDDKLTMESFVNPVAMNFYKIYINNERDLKQLEHLKNNAVVSVITDNNYKTAVETKLRLSKNVLEHRLSIVYSDGSDDTNTFEPHEIKDPMQQFIEFAIKKFGSSSILDDELARLRG